MGDYEELPCVKEDRVDLNHKGESSIGNILPAYNSQGEAKNHKKMMDQQLIGAPLSVIEQHVQGIIDEISYRKADQSMT